MLTSCRYFLPILFGYQSLITCLISVREQPLFFWSGSSGSVSLLKSVLFRLQLSEGRTFPFFSLLVLSPLYSEYYLGCCYLKAESFLFFSSSSVSLRQSILFGLFLSEERTFPFFSPGSVSLGQSVLFGLLLSEGRTFPFLSLLVLSLLSSQSYLGCFYLKA